MNDAAYIHTQIVNHLTSNAADLAVDGREVSVVPVVVTTAYKEEYPAVLIDAAQLSEFQRVVAKGGYYTFRVPVLCLDKTDGTQEDDSAARMRTEGLTLNVAKVLRTLPLKWMNELSIQFDGEVAETGNKVKNSGLTVSVKALIIDCT